MGRKDAIRRLDQAAIDRELDQCDILSNCRLYPKDEAPGAYKDFGEVLKSVESAGLAAPVGRRPCGLRIAGGKPVNRTWIRTEKQDSLFGRAEDQTIRTEIRLSGKEFTVSGRKFTVSGREI